MHSPFTRRLMLRAFEAGECLSASGHSQAISADRSWLRHLLMNAVASRSAFKQAKYP